MRPLMLTSYPGSRNVGDALQTLALSRTLGALLGVAVEGYVARCGIRAMAPWATYLVNGWHRYAAEVPGRGEAPGCIFAGIHADGRAEGWLRDARGAVGCRDPFTAEVCAAAEIPHAMVGCATLTLRWPRPWGGKTVLAVDAPEGTDDEATDWMTHAIDRRTPWETQLRMAAAAARRIAEAKLVITSRVHAACTAVAVGTPVVFYEPEQQPERAGLLYAVGVEPGKVFEGSAAARALAEDYVRFLKRALGGGDL